MTLLNETVDKINQSGLDLDDIIFIGSKDGKYSCNWLEFETLADRDYDSGYGGQEVASDLIIAFKCGTVMSRTEYDGSEWWSVVVPFKPFDFKGKSIPTLFPGNWEKLGVRSDD